MRVRECPAFLQGTHLLRRCLRQRLLLALRALSKELGVGGHVVVQLAAAHLHNVVARALQGRAAAAEAQCCWHVGQGCCVVVPNGACWMRSVVLGRQAYRWQMEAGSP
jgi:hypothetical protein